MARKPEFDYNNNFELANKDDPFMQSKLNDLLVLEWAQHLTERFCCSRGEKKRKNHQDFQLFRSMEVDHCLSRKHWKFQKYFKKINLLLARYIPTVSASNYDKSPVWMRVFDPLLYYNL